MTSFASEYRFTNAEVASMKRSDRDDYELFFEQTLNQFHPMIARTISCYEKRPALQQELYQEISVALWKALAQFNHRSSLKTYILSIAHKRAVSHIAKYVKEPDVVVIEEYHLNSEDCPSEGMLKKQKMNRLTHALSHLSMADRQLVILALEGVSYKDIAAILGLTVTNVGAKLNRAKSKLKQLLSVQVKGE